MSSATVPAPGSPFRPGDLFAGRYRMVTCLDRSPLGEVWRADDLVLDTPVALKLLSGGGGPADAAARERILNEVRIARQITDPSVCRVFDVGEADGTVFYTMELVSGEDLATVLRRAGRLPSEKVRDIGRQLCTGLMAAHSHGIVHRNLKASNVLLDQDGFVRITELGMAQSPEGAADDGQTGAHSDLYALGALLYELLVGAPLAAAERRTVRRPSSIVSDVDPSLERTILKALAPNPADRFRTAAEMAATLEGGPPPFAVGGTRARPWIAGAGLAVVLGLLAVTAAWLLPRGSRALTDKDTIVIGDFVNTTGEPVFDGALKVALAVALEQSPFLKVFPEDRVHDTLRLMQRDPASTPVTLPIAREIALREQLKAAVTGSIGPLGSHYVIALEAVNAQTGDIMAREQGEAAGKEQVLATLGSVAAALRETLGESLASVARFDAPLARATTTSLEALDAYSRALDQGRIVPRREAIPYLERAIELDPDFALAHALLSGVYVNTGRSSEAPPHSRKAFELRDRVSERERYFISWRYYMDATQQWDEALSLARAWTSTYPREPFAFNSLGLASSAFGQHDEAIAAFRKAIELDPKFIPPYGNLAGSLMAMNRFDDAKTALADAAAHGVDYVSVRRMSYLLGFVTGNSEIMNRQIQLARETAEAVWTSNWPARAAVFGGRFAAAHALYQDAAQAAMREGLPEFAAQWTMEDAEAHALAGQCEVARREVASGLQNSRDNFTLERASRALALCSDAAEATRLTTDLASRFNTATLAIHLQIPVTAAALAESRREWKEALALLEPVKPYDRAPAAEFWPAYLRGLAHLATADRRAAAEQFRSVIDRRGAAPTSALFPLAHLGLARAAAGDGDRELARRSYQQFLGLWQNADAGTAQLAEARRELDRLQ